MIQPGHKELLPMTGTCSCGAEGMRATERQASGQEGRVLLAPRSSCVVCLQSDCEDKLPLESPTKWSGVLQVGFDREGKLLALDVQLYNNAGNSLDLSAAIMDRALLHTDNAYKIPHLRVVGHICKTHCGSNTAFRGFGGPQVGPHQLQVAAAHARSARHCGSVTGLWRSEGLQGAGSGAHAHYSLQSGPQAGSWHHIIMVVIVVPALRLCLSCVAASVAWLTCIRP